MILAAVVQVSSAMSMVVLLVVRTLGLREKQHEKSVR